MGTNLLLRTLEAQARQARRKRFAFLAAQLCENPSLVSGQLRILDVGGEPAYWDTVGLWAHKAISQRCQLTILNISAQVPSHAQMECVIGDARDLMRYGDGAFDLVFSNSVIEHVGSRADQQRMADEVRRVGRSYYVQTPNLWFPIEPHLMMPVFHWLPKEVRIALHHRVRIGRGYPRQPDLEQARFRIEHMNLLSARDMRKLFPDAIYWQERAAGLVKSLVAYRF